MDRAFVDEVVVACYRPGIRPSDAADVCAAEYRGGDGVGEVFEYAAFFVRAYHAAYAVCAVDDAGVASAVYAAAVDARDASGEFARRGYVCRVDGVGYAAAVGSRDAADVILSGHDAFVIEAGHRTAVCPRYAAGALRVCAGRHAEAVGEPYFAADLVFADDSADRRRFVCSGAYRAVGCYLC